MNLPGGSPNNNRGATGVVQTSPTQQEEAQRSVVSKTQSSGPLIEQTARIPAATPIASKPEAPLAAQSIRMETMPSILGSDEFYISNYDPLQTHALQLSASAGYMQSQAPESEQTIQPNPQVQSTPVAIALQIPQQQFYVPPQSQQGGMINHSFAGGTAAPAGQVMTVTSAGQLAPQLFYPQPIPIQPAIHHGTFSAMDLRLAPPASLVPPSGNKRDAPAILPSNLPADKRQRVTYQGIPQAFAPGVSPQNVPSESASIDDDDEIDPINRKPPPHFATMSAEEKRRYERNVREQQRSFQISQQIKELRTVLSGSNIPFKPNKFSILMSVAEYIKQLQARAIMLDAEHRKLATTIHETTHMVNTGQTPEDQSSDGKPGGSIGNDAGMLFVQGLDYKAILEQCPAGLGVAALDGRIVACNEEFANISGFSRDELLRQSVFNLMQNHDEVFRAMGQMLSSSDAIVQSASDDDNPPPPMYWSGIVNQRSQNLFMNITLSRSKDGLPRFFNCALTTTT